MRAEATVLDLQNQWQLCCISSSSAVIVKARCALPDCLVAQGAAYAGGVDGQQLAHVERGGGQQLGGKGQASGRRLTRASAVEHAAKVVHEALELLDQLRLALGQQAQHLLAASVALLAHGAQIALGELLHQALDLVGVQVPGEQGDALALLLVVEHRRRWRQGQQKKEIHGQTSK